MTTTTQTATEVVASSYRDEIIKRVLEVQDLEKLISILSSVKIYAK